MLTRVRGIKSGRVVRPFFRQKPAYIAKNNRKNSRQKMVYEPVYKQVFLSRFLLLF